jgi:tetratricopeptide (TPR) repeat protein
MTDTLETIPSPADPLDENGTSTGPIEIVQAKKGKSKALVVLIVVIVLLVLLGGGGYAGLRFYESSAAQQSQVGLKNQQWAQVESTCNQALQLEQTGLMHDPAAFKLTRGEARYHLGKYDLALNDLQAIQNLLPTDARPYQIQAEIFYKQGKLKEALGAAEELSKRSQQSGFADALKAYEAYQKNQYTEALAGANSAIQREPTLALAYRVRGGVQILKGDTEAALADLNKALELEPGQPEALGLRVYAYSALNDEDKAKQDSEQLKTIALDSIDAVFAQAVVALNENKEAEANKLISQAIGESANSPLFYMIRSATFYKTEDFEKQLADLDQALKLYPDLIPAISRKASLLFSFYKKVDIEAEARRVLQLAPKNISGHLMLAQKYLRDLDWKNAQAEAEKIITENPTEIEGYLTRAEVYLEQNEIAKALVDYQKAIDLKPKSALGYVGMSRVNSIQHKDDDALKAAEQAQKLVPYSCLPLTMKAMILSTKKDKANAQKALDEAFKIDPACIDALALRAVFSLQDKDPMKAMSDVDKLGGFMPEHPLWMILRAQVYVSNKDADKALAELDKADNINYKISDSFMIRSQAYFLKDDYEKSYDILKRGIYLFPWNAGMHAALSQTNLNMFDDQQAIDEGTKALQLDGQLYTTYFTVGTAQWNLGNIEAALESFSKLKGYEKELDVNQLDALEKMVSFLQSIPKVVDGKRPLQNSEFNFQLNYSSSWVQRQPINSLGNIYQLDFTGSHGIARVEVMANKFERPVPTGLATVGSVANFIRAALAEKDSYEFISRNVIYAGNTQGYADTFIVTNKNDKGVDISIKMKYYYFVSSGSYVVIEYTAPAVLFANSEEKADEIAKSFAFINP